MKCTWQALLRLLPPKYREQVDKLGKDTLQELRLRSGRRPYLVTSNGDLELEPIVEKEELQYVVNAASRYSPWSSETLAKGFLTADGGHRIGVCGSAVVQSGSMTGYRSISSLCIRVARDYPGIAAATAGYSGSVLVIGPPGSGKTTLLRDMVRVRSRKKQGSVVVVDERGEIFPMFEGCTCFDLGARTDVLSGCGKKQGVELALRTMGPACIAVDEISGAEDCDAILNAGWCGVPILATAHASGINDLTSRPVYKPLVEKKLFDSVLVMRNDKSWEEKRLCT